MWLSRQTVLAELIPDPGCHSGAKAMNPKTGSLRDFHTKFGGALKRQAHREKAIGRVANELQKVGLRVVVHHIAARSDLRSQDFDNLARERRLLTIGPAIYESKIHRAAHIAQRLPRISLPDVGIVGKAGVGQITPGSGNLLRNKLRTDDGTAAIVVHGRRKIDG